MKIDLELTEKSAKNTQRWWKLTYFYISWAELIAKYVLCNINPDSAGIDFSRQNLTSVDVRSWRLKSTPAL